jgi:uncharacterized protein involved in exopolysaccharide biosynthesis
MSGTDGGVTRPELNSNSEVAKPQDTLSSITSIIEVTWKHRKKIAGTTFVVGVVVAIISLFLPQQFVATSTILPDMDFLNNLQDKLGGLQDIISAAGLSGSSISPSQLYPDIMESETVLRRVIYHEYSTERFPTPVNLLTYYGFNTKDTGLNYERCLSMMKKGVLSTTIDKKTLIISVEVTTPEKQLSADIANQITTELDYFQRHFRSSNASEQRKFLEQRLGEIKNDLATAEENLKDFQEKNRTVMQSAELLLEQGRLQREVDLNSDLFIELKKQYEMAKLDEIKNTPIVAVLDRAMPPATRAFPRRTFMVIISMLLAFTGSTIWFNAREVWRNKSDQMVSVDRFSNALHTIRTDLGSMFKSKKSHHSTV